MKDPGPVNPENRRPGYPETHRPWQLIKPQSAAMSCRCSATDAVAVGRALAIPIADATATLEETEDPFLECIKNIPLGLFTPINWRHLEAYLF